MKGVFYALLAALLFGASTPLAKALIPRVFRFEVIGW
jgi:hypothetical protein